MNLDKDHETPGAFRAPPQGWATLTSCQLHCEVSTRPGLRTVVLADPLYSFIHRTEAVPSLARVVAPGAQTFGSGTGIAPQFFDELDHAVALDVPGTRWLAETVYEGGALFLLASYFLDPESHFVGDRQLPHSVEWERRRLLWHERIWQVLNSLPPLIWEELVGYLESADNKDLETLRSASKKTESSCRSADLLAKAFVEYRSQIDTDRMIARTFPAWLQGLVHDLGATSRPSSREIAGIVEAAAELGPWPGGLDLAELAAAHRCSGTFAQELQERMLRDPLGHEPLIFAS